MPSNKICPKCNFDIHSGGFDRHVAWCDGRGPRRRRPTHNGICRYCGKDGLNPLALGGHLVSCCKNPKIAETRKKISDANRGKKLTQEAKQKLSESIMKKVSEGTWHLSFSKSRSHEYKGIKLHGMWEVKYATFLDEQGIKWRRPDEKFRYRFNEKDSFYTPDFFLEDEAIYVEIKGYKTPKDEAKWSQFPLKLRVLEGKDLIQLGILDIESVREIKTHSDLAQ